MEGTWGGDIPPRDGDIVYVPAGQTLLVDVNTPSLLSILVEGKILVLDGIDLEITTGSILIRKGTLTIGTYHNPRQNGLTISLTGSIRDP